MSVESQATAAAEEIATHLMGGISDACPECVDILQRHMQELVSPLQARIDLLISEVARLEAVAKRANGERVRTQVEIEKIDREVVQTLGKALHYPWFKDDQKNSPGATEADGVAVGDHVAETLSVEAAKRIAKLEELGPLIEEILNFTGDVAAMPVDAGIEEYRKKVAAILRGGE